MTKPADLRTRIARAVEDGDFDFWAEVVAVFPEARTGDLDPDVCHIFTITGEACIGDWLWRAARWASPGPPASEVVPDGIRESAVTSAGDVAAPVAALRARIARAIEQAETAFWQAAATAFSDVLSGDPDPEAARWFHLVAAPSVRCWVNLNVPGAEELLAVNDE